ncbi:endonuclease/exonuclease/phosphatase family protein [Streptomyces olivoreticuli]
MSGHGDEFRVASWNVQHNGIDRDGSDRRRRVALGVLSRIRPHVVLRQEMTGAAAQGEHDRWAEAVHLGRREERGADDPSRDDVPFVSYLAAPKPDESPNPTGVFVDPVVCLPEGYYEHVAGVWHPICNPVVRIKGTETSLSVASFHLCYYDADQRAAEARRLTTLGKPGMAAIIGGDCNSFPHRERDETTRLPDWTAVGDSSYYEHRTIERDGQRVSDTRPDEILAGPRPGGQPPVFIELGHYAATVLGQRQALEPTASLWRTDQGERRRIDRIYVTPQLAPALKRLEVITTREVREASDHALVLATFQLSALRSALSPSSATP